MSGHTPIIELTLNISIVAEGKMFSESSSKDGTEGPFDQ